MLSCRFAAHPKTNYYLVLMNAVAPEFHALSAYGIGFIAVVVAIYFVRLFASGSSVLKVRLTAGVVSVMTISAILALTGVMSRLDLTPPPMAVMIALVLTGSLALGFSRFGARAAVDVPLMALIGLQIFRLPLELVMHSAARAGVMPHALSYSGYNFDIITGIGALLIFSMLRAGKSVPRIVIWIWNLIGIYCLLAIAMIAIATSPMVHALGAEPHHLNTWVLFFPYVWLPVVLVTIAMISHIVITRKLLRTSNVENVQAPIV